MAVTFQRKITLRPGSVFCFGTISSVADEEGNLHRRSAKEEVSSSNLRKYRSKAGKSATSSALKKDRLQQARSRGPADPENSTVYLSDERMDTNRKEERNK
jgi:hypothetical protein